jgi:hypothetical protein
MPNGRQQKSGGWNRVILQVRDLPVRIADLKRAGGRFRNELEAGPAENRFKLKTPTAIRLSCSSPLGIEESQDKPHGRIGKTRNE